MVESKLFQRIPAIIRQLLPMLIVLTILSTGCKKEDELLLKESLKGYVQKGPYINGSAITLSELNNKLNPSGKVFSTQIVNNQGSFELNDLSLHSKYVELRADGFYFNEILGDISTAQLTLFALADIKDQNSVNVNLLTHLEKARVEYLMEEGLSFEDAKIKAQSEILNIFYIENSEMRNSEILDISIDGEDNAAMLAISLILQGYRSVEDLTELLANISNDIKEDGVLNSTEIKTELISHSRLIDTNEVRSNLENRFTLINQDAVIPGFEPYLNQFNESSIYSPKNIFDYPQYGFYGLNILNLEDTLYLGDPGGLGDGKYNSMKVSLPSPTSKIWVVLRGQCAIYQNNGWTTNASSRYQGTFRFQSEGKVTADLKIYIMPGTATIEIYENNYYSSPRIKVIHLTL